MARCNHNNMRRSTHTVRIGPEDVTYRDEDCPDCGYSNREIIARRKVKKDK